MGSMNNSNWLLGFSLLPHDELQNHSQNNNFRNSDEISGGSTTAGAQISATDDDESCFHLITSDPPPFPIFQAFNTNSSHSQDWNMKDVSMNSLSCSSSNLDNSNQNYNNSPPKLENFLGFGGHSFADQLQQHNKLICNSSSAYQLNNMYQQTHHEPKTDNNNYNNSTIGLSMIKNWLRNNPSAHAAAVASPENRVVGDAAAPPAGGAQTLSLSMRTGGSPLPLVAIANGTTTTTTEISCTSESKDDGQSGGAIESSVPRKSADTFGQRTSIYRGVTRHRWTGRYEAHLWDNSCRREGQTRKGRQVYLGGYDKEDKAARSYDLAALKYWGTTTTTNFPISNYEKEIEDMKHMTRQEYVASLRRKSSGFSRGASIYRGVTRHHQHGRWQARIGRVAGNKDLYLGTFSTQEEAAEAYDIAAIKFRGLNAVTNFEINRYDVKSIMESTTLPIGGAAKRLKDAENAENMALELHCANNEGSSLNLHYGNVNGNAHAWPTIAFQQAMYPNYSHQRLWCKQEQLDNNHNHGHFGHEISHQLQLGNNNTQNFLQPYMMEQSSVSNAGGYGNSSASGDDHGGSFAMPMMGTVVVQDNSSNIENQQAANGYHDHIHVGNIHEGVMFGSATDGNNYQQVRNLYYRQSQETSSSTKVNIYDHEGSNNCGSWNNIPTAVPTQLAVRNINSVGHVDSCHGASTFTAWNDT